MECTRCAGQLTGAVANSRSRPWAAGHQCPVSGNLHSLGGATACGSTASGGFCSQNWFCSFRFRGRA